MNTNSGIVNSHSGKSGKVFTRNQNECSRSARTGVHNEPEWVFILGRNMHTGIRSIIEPNKALLAKWISEASTTEGYGLARLMNDIWNDDEDFAREIVANVSATALADASSHVTTDTIYSVSELIDRLSLAADAQWKREYRDTLDKTQIRNMVSGWTENNRLFALGKYCYAISHYDEALALELARIFHEQL